MDAVHGYPVHPAAAIFPMLDEDALTALENDIKVNGQQQPIVVWDGQVVDGRNRYAACVRAGIKPKLREVKFADDAEAIRFIVSTNIHRRHMTDDQRRLIAARLVTMGQGGDRANPQSAGLVGVAAAAALTSTSAAGVERARTVLRADPALADEVAAGKKTLNKALTEVRERAKLALAKPQTDPDQAADSVIDATESRHATGDTPRARPALAAFDELRAAASNLERGLQRWWKAQGAVCEAGLFDSAAFGNRMSRHRKHPHMYAVAARFLAYENVDTEDYFSDEENPDLRIADSVAAWREAWLAGRVGVDGFEIEEPAKKGRLADAVLVANKSSRRGTSPTP